VKAFIHIGLAKTGTTSIQSVLASNREELERLGFYFPRSGTINAQSGHHCLAWSLAGSPKTRDFCQAFSEDAFRAEVGQKGEGRTVILSSEEFSALSFSYLGIRKLLRQFHGRDISVIAYVREQAEFFNSLYQEIISDFVDPGPAAEFARARMREERYDYERWFAIWADLLGRALIVRPFDRRFLRGGDAVKDFLNVVDLPLVYDSKEEILNSSWNNVQVAAVRELIQRVNDLPGSRPLPSHVRLVLKRMAAKLASHEDLAGGTRYWGIAPDLVGDIRRRYHSGNQSFFESHGVPDFTFSAAARVPDLTMLAFGDLPLNVKTSVDRVWKEMAELLRPK